MLKIIRDQVPQPQFLLMCDAECGTYVGSPIAPGDEDQQAVGLAMTMVQKGWKISLLRQLCPVHAQKAEGERKLIVLPSLVLGN